MAVERVKNLFSRGTQRLATEDEEQIDIRRYLRIVLKRLWQILLVTVLVVGAVTFYTLRLPKIYRATSIIQIDPRAPQVLGREVEEVSELGTGSYWSNKEYYETQYKVIKSRNVAERVVKSEKLHRDPLFLEPIETIKDKNHRCDPVSVDEAAKQLQEMVIVEPVKDSRLVNVSIEHPDAKMARKLVNAVADAYKQHNLEHVQSSTIDASKWLNKQLDTKTQELHDSEQALHDFKQDNNILSVSLDDRQNYLSNEIAKLTDGLGDIKKKRIELKAKKMQIESIETDDPLSMPITPLLDSPLIQNLKAQYAELAQDRGELAEEHGPNWPAMKEIDAKLGEIQKTIDREVGNVLKSIELQYREALKAEKGYLEALADLNEKALQLNLKEIEYNELYRKSESNVRTYTLLLERSEDARLQQILRRNNINILDRALTPEKPSKPRVKLNILLALIIGLMAGVGLAFFLEYMDVTIKTQDEVESEIGLPFLGIVPSIGSAASRRGRYGRYSPFKRSRRGKHGSKEREEDVNRDLYVNTHPSSAVAECVRSIRTNILFMSPDREIRKIMVTSPGPQEGKTTLVLNLAIAMAQSGSSVLVVDTDLRRPRVHKAFGMPNDKGITSNLLGVHGLDDTILKTEVENLYVLPCGPIPPNPAELIHTERFAALVTELGSRFDRIIFDSPPVTAVTDAAILVHHVDGAILILRPLLTHKSAARQAKRSVEDVGGRILGAVFNNLDLENRDYGYYHYYYYRKYGYYYGESRDSAAPASEPQKDMVDEP
jgi:capsular exopolysaccharide synthesis family protein